MRIRYGKMASSLCAHRKDPEFSMKRSRVRYARIGKWARDRYARIGKWERDRYGRIGKIEEVGGSRTAEDLSPRRSRGRGGRGGGGGLQRRERRCEEAQDLSVARLRKRRSLRRGGHHVHSSPCEVVDSKSGPSFRSSRPRGRPRGEEFLLLPLLRVESERRGTSSTCSSVRSRRLR